jgi:hypothetical protein
MVGANSSLAGKISVIRKDYDRAIKNQERAMRILI